jgi:Arc/MetJ-type ribon-helix-helix transcriptional regulator
MTQRERSPKTRPIGSNTRNVSVNMPVEMREQLKLLAKESGCKSLSDFIRPILVDAMAKRVRVSRSVTVEPAGSSSGQEASASAPPAEGGQIKSAKPQAGSPTRADDKRMLDAALESLKKRPPTKGGRE